MNKQKIEFRLQGLLWRRGQEENEERGEDFGEGDGWDEKRKAEKVEEERNRRRMHEEELTESEKREAV